MNTRKEAGHAAIHCAPFDRRLAIVLGVLLAVAEPPGRAASAAKAGLPPEIVGFIKEKETQAHALAKKLNLKVSPDVWPFFRTAQAGDTAATTNAFNRLKPRASQYEGSWDDPTVGTVVWQNVIEVTLAVDAFEEGDPKYPMAFGKGVIN